ncbi:MAG: hypothetical protein ACI4D0_05295 [Lachnospira sp.]
MFKNTSLRGKLVALLSFVTLIVVTVVPAFANNHSDSGFVFNFGNGYWQTTPERVKEDASYVYMKCTTCHTPGDSYEAYVWGYNSSLDSDFESGGPYSFKNGVVHKMTNYVYENDGDYAYVKARHTGSGVGIFSGVWSPDSI